MTARSLLPPLLKAGTKIRDLKITHVGQPAYIMDVQSKIEDRWGKTKAVTYSSKEQIYLLIDWQEARLSLDFMDFSEEEDDGVEAYARFKDDIRQGAIIEVDTRDENDMVVAMQQYKVTKVRKIARTHYMSKSIWIVPYRTDTR